MYKFGTGVLRLTNPNIYPDDIYTSCIPGTVNIDAFCTAGKNIPVTPEQLAVHAPQKNTIAL